MQPTKTKSKLNKEKLNDIIENFANKLKISHNECYPVVISEFGGTNAMELAIMHVFEDKFTYEIVGENDFLLLTNDYRDVTLYNSPLKISNIFFEKIFELSHKGDVFLIKVRLGSKNFKIFKVTPVGDDSFYEIASNKFNQFKETQKINADANLSDNIMDNHDSVQSKSNENNQDHVQSNSTDKNPFEIIKKSKELLDMGAITQEEFNNIKSKYLDDF